MALSSRRETPASFTSGWISASPLLRLWYTGDGSLAASFGTTGGAVTTDDDTVGFCIVEARHGVVRMNDSYWPHDCHEFDLLSMTLRYGQQGSVDSEDPDDWYRWESSRLRVHEGHLERWVDDVAWAERRENLEDWVRRTEQAHAMAPELKKYSDPNEALNVLREFDKTRPGWTRVREDFGAAALAYAKRKGLSL